MRGSKIFTTLHDAVEIFLLLNCLLPVDAGDTLGTVEFEAGDQILIAVLPVLGLRYYPYHAYFAISKTELVDIAAVGLINGKVRPEIIKRDELPDYIKDISAKVIKPDPRKPRLKLSQSIALAKRMVGKILPYHLLRCNCRHYADFLTYGRTYGSIGNPAYLPMNNRCPFKVKITENTDVRDKNFLLWDKKKRPYRLLNPRQTLRRLFYRRKRRGMGSDSDSDSDSSFSSGPSFRSGSSFSSGSSLSSDSSFSSGSSIRSGSSFSSDSSFSSRSSIGSDSSLNWT